MLPKTDPHVKERYLRLATGTLKLHGTRIKNLHQPFRNTHRSFRQIRKRVWAKYAARLAERAAPSQWKLWSSIPRYEIPHRDRVRDRPTVRGRVCISVNHISASTAKRLSSGLPPSSAHRIRRRWPQGVASSGGKTCPSRSVIHHSQIGNLFYAVLVLSMHQNPRYHFSFLYDGKNGTVSGHARPWGEPCPVLPLPPSNLPSPKDSVSFQTPEAPLFSSHLSLTTCHCLSNHRFRD